MTKFEFQRQNPINIREKFVNQIVQKLKPFIEEEGKINPRVKIKLEKYLADKKIQKRDITEEEIINKTIEMIKEENGDVLPEYLKNIEAA